MQDGFLTVSVIDSATNRPVENATVNIYKKTESGEAQTQVYQNLKTNNSGQVSQTRYALFCNTGHQMALSHFNAFFVFSVYIIKLTS